MIQTVALRAHALQRHARLVGKSRFVVSIQLQCIWILTHVISSGVMLRLDILILVLDVS